MSSRTTKLTRIKEGAPVILYCAACGEIQSAMMKTGMACPLCGAADVRLQSIGEDDDA